MDCMQNLEKQVGQIFKMLKKTDDRSEKDAIIATLQSELKSASMKVEDLWKKMNRQEQYSRRNCFLIHGLK